MQRTSLLTHIDFDSVNISSKNIPKRSLLNNETASSFCFVVVRRGNGALFKQLCLVWSLSEKTQPTGGDSKTTDDIEKHLVR